MMQLSKVSFRPRVDLTMQQRLVLKATEAGISQADALAAVNVEIMRVCEMAATAQVRFMLDTWTPQQWQAAAECYGSHNHCFDEQ